MTQVIEGGGRVLVGANSSAVARGTRALRAQPRRAASWQVAAAIAWLSAGLLLMASHSLPWASQGPGSTRSARVVADLVLSGVAEGWAPRWLGMVWYLVPLAGGFVLLLASATSSPWRRLRAVLVLVGLTSAVTVVLAADVGVRDLGSGALLVVGAVFAGALGSLSDRLARGTRR